MNVFYQKVIMRKIMLYLILLNIYSVAKANTNDIYNQPILTNVVDTGTAKRPNVSINWQSFPDSPEHANTNTNCIIGSSIASGCYYGLFLIYRETYSSAEKMSCIPSSSSGGCMYVSGTKAGSSPTLGELGSQWLIRYGTVGSKTIPFSYRPYFWQVCFAFNRVPSSAGNSNQLEHRTCTIIPEVPVSCNVSSDTLELQHGTLSLAELNSASAQKSVTKSFTINCSRTVSAQFNLLQSEINFTDGLKSTLSMKYNGININSGNTVSMSTSNKNVDITSTLSAKGNIPPNAYSGSTALIINLL